VATNTIEATLFYFMTLERACQVQLMADAAAGGRGIRCNIIPPEVAAATYKSIGTPWAGWFQALPEFQILEAREGNTLAAAMKKAAMERA